MSRRFVDENVALAALNSQFFRITDRGKFSVMHEVFSRVTQRIELYPMSVKDFCDSHANQAIIEDGKAKPMGRWWIESDESRSYDEIIFNPARDYEPHPRVYNRFRGFGVAPTFGEYPIIKFHIEEVLCNGDAELANFIYDWIASLVQRPERPGGICLAFRGKQGSGKTTFGHILKRLVGPQHFLQVSNSRHIVGHFNGQLEDALVCSLEEAFWSGDKQGLSTFKSLITDNEIIIERKGRDARRVKNCTHIVMTSNFELVVPMEKHDRRFVVSDVCDKFVGDKDYFARLYAAINGGVEIPGLMLAMMQRRIPDEGLKKPTDSLSVIAQNAEQLRQMWHTQDPFMAWLDGRLSDGITLRKDESAGWQVEVKKSDLYDDFKTEMKETNQRFVLNDSNFSRRLLKVLPNLQTIQRRLTPEQKPRYWVLPALPDAWDAMEAYAGVHGLYDRRQLDAQTVIAS